MASAIGTSLTAAIIAARALGFSFSINAVKRPAFVWTEPLPTFTVFAPPDTGKPIRLATDAVTVAFVAHRPTTSRRQRSLRAPALWIALAPCFGTLTVSTTLGRGRGSGGGEGKPALEPEATAIGRVRAAELPAASVAVTVTVLVPAVA